MNDEVPLDDLFHGCALRAFVEQAERTQSRLAYRYYEEALATSRRRDCDTQIAP